MSIEIIYSIAIGIGAVIFIYPVFLFYRVIKSVDDMTLDRAWLISMVLTVFFGAGYTIMALHYALGWKEFNHDALITSIFFFGSVFVFITAKSFCRIVRILDSKVKKRTKELEKQHQEAIKKEKQIQQLKNEFLFLAAHELRTPVSAMRWNLEVLFEDDGRRIEKCGPENVEIIEDIRRNNEYLVGLVDDLLDASRMEYGTFKLHPEQVNPVDVAKDAFSSVKPLAEERGIEMNASFMERPCIILTDPRRLKEVLLNLLSNAIKYNVHGGSVEVKVHCHDDDIQFDVIDTGIGIAPEDMNQLFGKFSRLDTDAAGEVRGTGLGLYISKEIVNRMDGEIWAESEGAGKGSRFSFTVPLIEPEDESDD